MIRYSEVGSRCAQFVGGTRLMSFRGWCMLLPANWWAPAEEILTVRRLPYRRDGETMQCRRALHAL
jgi:hypothetical protein